MEQEIDKKMKNEFFMVAVDHIFKEGLVGSQKELAEKIGITESALSRIKNNKKFVGDDTLRKMDEAFGGIFNMPYFRGQSVYLLKEDAAEAMMKSIGKNEPSRTQSEATPDPSSIMNAALSAQMQTIESLKNEKATLIESHARELKTKDELIQSLRDQLAAKDQLIAEQKSRLIEYRRIIDSQNLTGNYPFPVGFADEQKQRKNL